jgi:hypothetical protein
MADMSFQEVPEKKKYTRVRSRKQIRLFSGKILFKHGLMFPGKCGDTPS